VSSCAGVLTSAFAVTATLRPPWYSMVHRRPRRVSRGLLWGPPPASPTLDRRPQLIDDRAKGISRHPGERSRTSPPPMTNSSPKFTIWTSDRSRARRRPRRPRSTYSPCAIAATESHRDGLANPPGGVRCEAEALDEIEPLDRESKALLPQAKPLLRSQRRLRVPAREPGHDPPVRGHDCFEGSAVPGTCRGHQFSSSSVRHPWSRVGPLSVFLVPRSHEIRLSVATRRVAPGRRAPSAGTSTVAARRFGNAFVTHRFGSRMAGVSRTEGTTLSQHARHCSQYWNGRPVCIPRAARTDGMARV
jgi:hypothetical protein